MKKVSLVEAKAFAKEAKNYVQHSTVKVLDIPPAEKREVCPGYDQALVFKVRGRTEPGREYSLVEIEAIGYDLYLITKEG